MNLCSTNIATLMLSVETTSGKQHMHGIGTQTTYNNKYSILLCMLNITEFQYKRSLGRQTKLIIDRRYIIIRRNLHINKSSFKNFNHGVESSGDSSCWSHGNCNWDSNQRLLRSFPAISYGSATAKENMCHGYVQGLLPGNMHICP